MADQSFLDAINGDPLTAVQRAQDWLAKANAAPAQPKSVVAAQNFLSAIDSTPPPQIDKTWDEFKLGNNTDAMSAGGQAEQYKLWNAQYAIPYAKSYIADPAQQTAWLKTAETDAVAQGLVKIAPKDGNVAKDFALGVGQGVVGSVDSLFKLFNPAAKSPVDAAVEYLKGAVSDQSKDQALRDAETAKAAADKAKAEGKGEVAQWFAEFGQSLTNAVKNPVSLGSIAGSAATSFVPGAIVGKGLQVAGAGAKAIRAGAIGANTVFGAAVEAGGARSDSYDAIAKMPIDQLRQTPAYQTAKSLAPNASDDVLREQLAQSAAEFTNRGTLLAGAAGGVGGALGAFGLGGKTKVGRFATELISEPVTEGITPVGTNINVRTVDPTRTLTEGTANAAAQGLIGGVGGGIADSSLSKAKQAFGAPVVNDPLLSPNANKENAPNFNYGNYDVFAKANPEFVDYLRSASPTTLDRIVADPDPKAPLLTQALINLSADPKTAELAGRTINYLAGLANDAGTSQTDTSQTTASTTTDQETTGALSGATSELQRPSPDAAQRADVPPVGGATEQTTSQTVQPVAGPNVLGQAASSVVGRSNAQGNIVPTRQDGGRPAATGSLDFNPLDGERTAIERLLRAAVPADYPIIAKAHAESYAQYLAQENADGNPTQGVPDFEAKTLQAMRDYANGKKPKAGNTSANGARIDAQGALVPESQYIATLDASQPTLFRQANAAPFLATDAGQPAIDRVKQRIESVLGSGALARLPNVNIIAGNGTVQQTAAQGFFNPADGQITLVADNIKAGNEIAVLMHEIGHKRLAQSLGATGYKRLNDAVKAWKSKPAESNERQVYDFANAQAKQSGNYDAEFLAYAIERAEQLGLSPDVKKPVGTVENWLALASKLFSAAFGKLGLGKRPDLTVQDLTALARGAALLELTGNAPTAKANLDRNTPSESDILYSKQSALAADIEQAINAAAPNRPVKLVAPKQPLDVGWALRQALVDYQAPVAKMLDTVFGEGEHLNSRLWQSLKTYSTQRDAAGEAFNSGDRRVIDDAIKVIADHSGMDIAEAAGVAGEYAKVVHIPDGNRNLEKLRAERLANAQAALVVAEDAALIASTNQETAKAENRRAAGKKASLGKAEFLASMTRKIDKARAELTAAINEVKAAEDPKITLAGGLTDAQAKATQQAIEQRIPVALLQAAQQGLVAANRNALQRLVDAGIATKETQAKLLADYPNYVPLFVTDDVTDPFNSLGRSDLFTAGMNETVLKAMKGYGKDSASVAENGYVTTIAKIAAINARIASQDFKLAALAMSRLPQGQGHVESKAITSPTQQLDPRGMSVRDPVTGEWHSVSFVDQSVADSVYNRNVEDNNDLVAKAIGIPTRILSKAVTQFVLAFAPINMIRDTQAKILLSRTSKYLDAQGNPVSPTKLGNRVAANAANPNTWRAAFDIAFGRTPANPSPTYLAMKEAIDNGALSTWGDVLNKSKAGAVDTLKQQYGLRKIPTTMLQTVEGYNTWFDMISSMSSYLAMRELGIDPKSAAFNTLDMMNFRNKGAKTGTIRAFYAFANPTLQDSAKIVQLLKTRRGQVDTLALIAIGTAIYAMTKAIAGDDEEKVLGNIVDQRGTFESERTISLCINKDFCLKVPVGFGQAQIAWLIATTGSRMNSGRYTTTEGLGELAKGAAKTFSPVGYSEVPVATDPFGWLMSTLVPTIFKPSYAVAANKSAFGTPLAKPEKKGVFRSENAKASTEALWVETAQSFRRITGGDIAPEYIKEIILGLPMFAGPVAESIKAATNNKSERGAKLDIRDELRYLMPLGIGRVIGGDAHYLEASYYEQLKDGERLIKQLNLDVPKLGASKLGKSGTDFTKRVEQSTTMSAADKLLAVAYFNESRRAQSAAMDKAKDLKPLTGADNADKRLEVITQYSDESRSAMLQYLKDSGFRAK